MSSEELTPDDVGKLKVTELRAELKARDLPTGGLKKELADRLLENLSGSNTPAAAAEEQEEQAEPTIEPSQEEENTSPTTPGLAADAPAAPATGLDVPTDAHPSGDSTAQTSAEAPTTTSTQPGTEDLPSELPAVPPAATSDSVADFEGAEGSAKEETATAGVQKVDEPSEVVKPVVDSTDKTPGFTADSKVEQARQAAEVSGGFPVAAALHPAANGVTQPPEAVSALLEDGVGESLKRKRDDEEEPPITQSSAEPAVQSIAAQEEESAPANDSIQAAPAAEAILGGAEASEAPEAKRTRTDENAPDAAAASEPMLTTLSAEDIAVPQGNSADSVAIEDVSTLPPGHVSGLNGNSDGGFAATAGSSRERSSDAAPRDGPSHSLNIKGSSSGAGSLTARAPRSLFPTQHQQRSSQSQQQNDVSRASTATLTSEYNKDRVASSSSSALQNNKKTSSHSSSSRPPVSKAICLSNLVRPFTLAELQGKIEEFGEVDHFWINSVKSHCYVTFNDVSAAESASAALEGEKWPETTGKPLTVTYIPPERISDLVEKEQAAGRARYELVVTRDDDAGEWIYNVEPYTANATAGGGRAPLGPAPPVPRGLASSLPLQARTAPGQASSSTIRGSTVTATSANGAPIQIPSGSAFAQSRPPSGPAGSRRDDADDDRPQPIWRPQPGNEGVFKRTKTQPELFYRPVDPVAAGRKLRDLERGPSFREGGGGGGSGWGGGRLAPYPRPREERNWERDSWRRS